MLLIKLDLTDEQSRNGTNKYLYIDIRFVISETFVVWDVVLPRSNVAMFAYGAN